MSEQSELTTAAATGAAAAVAAVQDDQADEARNEAMEAATVDATLSADEAAERAEAAAEAATEAVTAAVEATELAQQASGVAGEAAAEAYDVRADMDGLRNEMREGWSSLRTYLDERFNPRQSEEPTEVVVTHESRGDSTAERRSNPGGDDGTGNRDERPPRHRFGRQR